MKGSLNKTAKTDAFHGRLNSRSETRTKLVAKTLIPQVLACMSLCWLSMTICGKNVDTLQTGKRSNRDFFRLYNLPQIPTIPSSPVFVYITRGVLRCHLGLWGQKPCGGNYAGVLRCLLGFLAKNPAGKNCTTFRSRQDHFFDYKVD